MGGRRSIPLNGFGGPNPLADRGGASSVVIIAIATAFAAAADLGNPKSPDRPFRIEVVRVVSGQPSRCGVGVSEGQEVGGVDVTVLSSIPCQAFHFKYLLPSTETTTSWLNIKIICNTEFKMLHEIGGRKTGSVSTSQRSLIRDKPCFKEDSTQLLI